MDQNCINSANTGYPQRRPSANRHTVLQAILDLQKLNGCSVNNLKKYLANQFGNDCRISDAIIKPIMKMAMDRNILKNLGDISKVSECKRRRKSSGGGKKRRKSKGRKGKKSSRGKKSGGKRRRRKSKKAAAEAV